MLKINNLHAKIEDKKILNGVNVSAGPFRLAISSKKRDSTLSS